MLFLGLENSEIDEFFSPNCSDIFFWLLIKEKEWKKDIAKSENSSKKIKPIKIASKKYSGVVG